MPEGRPLLKRSGGDEQREERSLAERAGGGGVIPAERSGAADPPYFRRLSAQLCRRSIRALAAGVSILRAAVFLTCRSISAPVTPLFR